MPSLYLFNLKVNHNTNDGLFNFNITLFLVIFQFMLLMRILDLTFYKPLLFIKAQRRKYIKKNVEIAKKIDFQSVKLERQYKKKVENIMFNTKVEFKKVRCIHKETIFKEVNILKKDIDKLFSNLLKELIYRDISSHKKLKPLIKVLSGKMYAKLLM